MDLLHLIDLVSFSVGTAIVAGALCILAHIIWIGSQKADLRVPSLLVAAVLFMWGSAMLYLSTIGNDTPLTKQTISPNDFWGSITAPILTLLPILGFFWVRKHIASLRALTDAMNLRLLIGVQAYRMTGSIFLLFALQGTMPGLIGIPTGISAFLVGLLGVGLAIFYRPQSAVWRGAADLWNWFGLGYFSYATILCLLCVAQVIDLTPDPIPIFFYPIAFIGSFGVPFSVILHFIAHARIKSYAVT